MRFYDSYEQKVNTWCFIILTGTIIWTFFFKEWDNSSARAMQLAQLDHKMPTDTDVVKIKALLVKLSKRYDLPVDSIADKIELIHDVSYNKTVIKYLDTNTFGKYFLKVSNLKLLQVVDKLDDNKVPGGGSGLFNVRIQIGILMLGLKAAGGDTTQSK